MTGCWLLWILWGAIMIVLVLLCMSTSLVKFSTAHGKHKARCLTCPPSLSFPPPLEYFFL